MKKHLLVGLALSLGSAMCAYAQDSAKSYFSDDLGETNGVSDNGRFAAIGDVEMFRAYYWDYSNPDVFVDITPDPAETADLPSGQRIVGALAYDITDDGTLVVGALYYADGKYVPAYYKDGKWTPLPLAASSMNTNEAIAVTPDGKTIAGYSFMYDQTSDVSGRFYPVQWNRLSDGSYELRTFDIELPDHQGFYPMAQSPDGRVIAGQVYCGAQSTIPGMVVDGELRLFDEITTKSEPWEYKGKWYCGFDSEGKQIWTDDPDDPRIVLFTEVYINGYKDSEVGLSGAFANCDANGNFYGMRTLVQNPQEDGTAELVSGACIYNVNTGEWIYNDRLSVYTAGVGTDLLFANDCIVLIDGKERDITEEYDIDSSSPVAGINKCSANGLVLGGMRYEINEATGSYQYFPFITVAKDAYASVSDVYGGAERASFVVSGSTVSVRNAASMTVYDLEGRVVGCGTSVTVAPGVYVLSADGVTAKVSVR